MPRACDPARVTGDVNHSPAPLYAPHAPPHPAARAIESHRAHLRQQISNPALDDAQRTALLREDHDLRVLKQQPIPPPVLQ